LTLIPFTVRSLERHKENHHFSLLSLTPITFDFNTLSCYGGSYCATIAVVFIFLPKTSEICWAINARQILDTSSKCHYLLFRVLFPIRIVLFSYRHTPEGAALIFTNIPLQLLSYTCFELHGMSMGHAHLVCTHFIFHTFRKVRSYRFPSPSNGSLLILSISLFLTTILSVEETLMNFNYTYAPNLIHQGASVITEISSAHGYRNPASPNSY
jgi:hypothetical protein